VKNVGEPCAGEPHARIEAAAGGNQRQSVNNRTMLAPPADPTSSSKANAHAERFVRTLRAECLGWC
jgi:hypothetical protein